MSMHLSVYVGPFLRCAPKKGVDEYELTSGRLCALRGELGINEECAYVGPNVDMPAIDRELSFSHYTGDDAVVTIDQSDAEKAAFIEQFHADIETLRKAYATLTVEWGVVPGFW